MPIESKIPPEPEKMSPFQAFVLGMYKPTKARSKSQEKNVGNYRRIVDPKNGKSFFYIENPDENQNAVYERIG